ncbi:uncharacterized protein LOC121422895 [Lytechinus variegatus]|uniref:uncharacterized protein LOC121422895 n=1 Tax=Lytechinus variegatus TaxID=7654 RepID=UPI001BB19CAE|nr:uncharacterized protein LOC121422895 [Lytechinus variegatus]
MLFKALLSGTSLLLLVLLMTQRSNGSTLPEEFHPREDLVDLTGDEREILTAFRQYLDSSLRNYQRELHTTYSQNTLEFNRRKKRELLVNEDLSWDIQFEASFSTDISIIKYFESDGDHYVIVGFNKVDEGIYQVDAEIFKYSSGAFSSTGVTFRTNGVKDIEPFLLEGKTYIAVANGQFGANRYQGFSQVLTFDPSVPSVSHVQYFYTFGAAALEAFIYEGDTYLGIANGRIDSYNKYQTSTVIYRFAGAHFDEVASVRTVGASDIAHAILGYELYIAIAQYQDNDGSYDKGTLFYNMYVDPSTDESGVTMIKKQVLASTAPTSLKFFVHYGYNYLAISNHLEVTDGVESTLTDSSIYWWASDEQFIEYQTISTDGAISFEYLDLEYDPKLLVAVDRTGLRFFEFTDDAAWEETDTNLYLYESSTRLSDVHLEAFSMDSTDYIAISGELFWTTEHRNLTESNFFSFVHVNDTTVTNVTEGIYLPSCIKELTEKTAEGITNITDLTNELSERGLSKTKEKQVITSNIVITGTAQLPVLKTKTLTIESGQEYEVDPALIQAIDANGADSTALQAHPPNFVTKSTEQTIEGSITLSAPKTIVSGNAQADSFTADDNYINEIDLSYIDTNALRLTGSQTMTGQADFVTDVTVGTSVTVSGDINSITVPDDVMDKPSSQTVAGSKTFDANVNINANVDIKGNINDLDLNSDVVLSSRSATVAGAKTFSQQISLSQPMGVSAGKTVDTVDVSEFSSLVLSIENGGVITGDVDFDSTVDIPGDVSIEGSLINDVDFTSAYNDAVFYDTEQTITVSKTFLNDLKSEDDVTVDGEVNGVDISESVFTLSGTQTIDTQMVIVDGSVTAKQDVNLTGTVNGIDLSEEAVFSDIVQTITGTVIFTKDIVVAGNTIVTEGTTVDGVDISAYAETAIKIIDEPQSMAGVKTFSKTVTVSGSITVSGDVNGVDIEDLYDDVLAKGREQTFEVEVEATGSVELSGAVTLQSTIDDLTIPDDFVLLGESGDIGGYKTFSDLVSISGALTMGDTKTINGEDLSAFNVNILKISGNQELSLAGISFDSALSIIGDVTVTGTVEGYTIPTDLVLLAEAEEISDCKTFSDANVVISGDISTPDLNVAGTVDLVDIDTLYSDAVMTASGGDCTIAGRKTFPNFEVTGETSVEGTVDGVNLLTLKNTAVYLAGAQDVAGDKSFSAGTTITGNVAVTNHVNSVDFAQKSGDVIYKDTIGEIRGAKTLSGGLAVTGDMDVDGLINGVNVTLLDETYLSKQYEQTLDGKKTFKESLTLANLDLASGKTLDTVDPSNFLLLADDETLSNDVSFSKAVTIQGSADVEGFINTVDIEELDSKTVRLTGDSQSVSGVKSFPSITVNNNIVIDPGLVDGVDVSDLSNRVLRSTVDNDISVRTVFEGAVTVSGNLLTEALTGGVNLTNLFQDAVLLSDNITLDGTVVFDSTAVTTMENMVFEDDLDLLVNLAQSTLEVLMTTTIRASTDQNITGNVVFDDNLVLQDCLNIDGTTDSIDISEHAVLKSSEQTISSCTRFGAGFRVDGDMTVGGTVDDVNLATLVSSRVTYSTEQDITGVWVFDDVTVSGNVTIDGTLNEIDVGDDLVTLHKNAVITGTKSFTASLEVITDLDTAEINDIDVIELKNLVVLNEGTFSISGEKTFESPISITADTDVTGYVNCVDVGLLDDKYEITSGDFYNELSQLNESMREHCISASTMQTSIGDHPLLLTNWEDLQEIDNPAAGQFHSVGLEDGNTLVGLAETYNSAVDRCIGTQLYLCPANKLECFEVLDTLLPAATVVYLYRYEGETFIVLLPSQQVGQCEERSDDEVDILTVLKLENEDYSVTLTAPHALGVSMFEIDGRLFMAVANYRDISAHNTDLNSTVYVYNNVTENFDVFQEIMTHGAFAVTHLKWKGITWLCFANNVLDFKSPIYVYDSQENKFVIDEKTGTNHASHVSMFLIDDVPFAAISSEKLIGEESEAEFHREITILAYQNGKWSVVEGIETYGIIDTVAFAIDHFVYLVGVSLEGGDLTIYEWHSAGMFELYQSIPFSNQYSAHAFVHNHEILLALARPAFTSIDIYSWKSKIMKAVIRGKTKGTVLKAW